MAPAPSPALSRRHSLREDTGKFRKATPARPGPSPHHGAVQSAYDAAQVTKTRAFTPHSDAQTPSPA